MHPSKSFLNFQRAPELPTEDRLATLVDSRLYEMQCTMAAVAMLQPQPQPETPVLVQQKPANEVVPAPTNLSFEDQSRMQVNEAFQEAA